MDEKLADWLKVLAAWASGLLGYVIESITLGRVVLFATLILTCLQIYVTWRDKVASRPRKGRREP
jgi:hypothetical protein